MNPGMDFAAPSSGDGPLPDPIAEARRLVAVAAGQGLTVRLLGGVAVHLQGPPEGLLIPRAIRDIDLAAQRKGWQALAKLMKASGYVADDMFNAAHGSRRLLFYDEANERKLDVFVGEFSMCHALPIADRLDRQPLTIPLAELLLTKLQIVELTQRDQFDVYNLVYHNEVAVGKGGAGIESGYIAELCARDWGLWRTCTWTIERCMTDLPGHGLAEGPAEVIGARLGLLRSEIERAPKSTRWKLRSRVGDKVRWYEEPEEHKDTV
ncbi:MAG: hypothetical protein ACHQ0J_10680 [Candidatus Dormibacterales bacterium]